MKIKLDSASDTVDDISATPCPMSSSEVVNVYGSFSMESNCLESEPPTGN
jgi:hypothetical protein